MAIAGVVPSWGGRSRGLPIFKMTLLVGVLRHNESVAFLTFLADEVIE